jgi:DNA-directed RNA polymerase subunit RPC12/RpoP
MKAISVQLRTSCSKCGSPLPLNAMVPRLACSACSAVNPLPDAFWTAVLGDNDLSTCTIITEGRQVALEVGRSDNPLCVTCEAEIPAKDALAAADAGFVACPGCGGRNRVRVPPRSWVLSGFKLLVGEDEMQIPAEGAALQTPRAAKPIAFNCPTCGGVLQVDGSARVVQCQYCSSSAYLPDDLWHVFHPVAVARPWYLLRGGDSRKKARKEAENPATTAARLAELAEFMDQEVREAVAKHPHASEATLRALVAADESLATDVLENPALPEGMWALLAGMEQSWISSSIAGRRSAPPEVLRTVAAQVAHRLSDDWAGDDDVFDVSDIDDILESLAENPNSPAEVLAEVARLNADRPPSDRADLDEHLAKNANTPAEVLAALVRSEDDSARQAVAEHRATPAEVLESLAADAEWNVREAVAKRTELRPETLKRLGSDADDSVQLAARSNPSYPRFNLWKALFGG